MAYEKVLDKVERLAERAAQRVISSVGGEPNADMEFYHSLTPTDLNLLLMKMGPGLIDTIVEMEKAGAKCR